jgi:hypothetical protein
MMRRIVRDRAAYEFFLPFESPSSWLGKTLRERGISNVVAARHVGVNPSDVSHWLNDGKPIPRGSLGELAELLCPDDLPYVDGLKTAEGLTDRVLNTVAQLCALNDCKEKLSSFLLDRLQRKYEALYRQQVALSRADAVSGGIKLLMAADSALRAVIAVNLERLPPPLVTTVNVAIHLRFPYNHFFGLLLDLPSDQAFEPEWGAVITTFRDASLRSLRMTAATGLRGTPSEALLQDHSRHMLCRHGSGSDQETIRASILGDKTSADPMTRRLAYAGLSLRGRDSEISERYLYDLVRDDDLRLANLLFDAIHYGDVRLGEVGPRYELSSHPPLNALGHILRHIVFTDGYQGIQAVEEQTLSDILHVYGPVGTTDLAKSVRRSVPQSFGENLSPNLRATLEALFWN